MLRISFFTILIVTCSCFHAFTQHLLLQPDRIFDGEEIQEGWLVLIEGSKIKAVGPKLLAPAGTPIKVLKGMTLLPGLIEGHSHILLHPYNETTWNDQVLFESEAERVIRAHQHLKASLNAGFTTLRDLGTEGARFADVGIKEAMHKNIFVGPDLICAGKAIVATSSYAVKSAAFKLPQGAEEADGPNLIRIVRDQIGHGADVIKIYADYYWGPFGQAMPTFTEDEIRLVVQTAASSGRMVVAHATTKEGMMRSTRAGVKTIEHGDEGDREVFDLMKRNGVALCPTLTASEAVLSYRGWNKSTDTIPERLRLKRLSFTQALQSGVGIIMGGDVGVFKHGDNVRELLLMQEYGMTAKQVLMCATSGNADILELKDKGRIKMGRTADLIACSGNPLVRLEALKDIKFVMKSGQVIVP